MGVVGMAINGLAIYSSMAANTDNIFAESDSFDQCQGHPDGNDMYHYHSEPYALSYEDDNLIGILRDGYFVYGRYDAGYTVGTTTPPGTSLTADEGTAGQSELLADGASGNLYVYGGHTTAQPTLGASGLFHYHVTEWAGCYDESGMTKQADDGETDDSVGNQSPSYTSCGGTLIKAWFLTGHGNGGVYETTPFGSGQTPSQLTDGLRYYYGKPESVCTNCN